MSARFPHPSGKWLVWRMVEYQYSHVICLFSWRYNPWWLYFHSPVAGFSLLVFEVFWSHTTTSHSLYDSSGRVINPSQRPLPDITQYLQQTNIRATGGIRTHNLGRRAAEDLHLRTRGHWDRQSCDLLYCNMRIVNIASFQILIYSTETVLLSFYPALC
jgi:hypothetical protein